MALGKANRERIAGHLSRLEAFHVRGVSMAAICGALPTGEYGRLPHGEWRALYRSHADRGIIRYTVTSHETPIAWIVPMSSTFDRESLLALVPCLIYSATSARHENLCAEYLGSTHTSLLVWATSPDWDLLRRVA